jgi:hypothetical protein
MNEEDLFIESFKYTEKPWPQNESVTHINSGICERGRKWLNLNLDQIMYLFSDIIKDSPEPIEYFDIHLTYLNVSENDAYFDVELKSYIRGFPAPNNYPSSLFKNFVHAFAVTCDETKNNENILRLEIHRDGFFWDLPLSHKLLDEGFYEDNFT